MILIDTSAWIDFFRNREPLAEMVDQYLEANQAAICGPVLTELRTGFRSMAEREKILELMGGCRWLAQPSQLWEDAGDCGFVLRKQGKTIKTMDLLIAAHAVAHQVPILSLDKEFLWIRKAGFALEVVGK